MPTITAKEKAKFLEKTETGEYVQKLLETVTDQVLSEEAIAGQSAGATLTAILKAIWTKASTVDGVASIKVGSDSAQAKTGNVVITLADFGTVAITAEQVALITANKNGLASLKSDVEANYAKKSDITAMFKYKGVKATQSELPSSGNAVGDVWYVTAKDTEYVWKGSEWEEFGPAIDLSSYATQAWVTEQVNTAKTALNSLISANSTKITGIIDGTTKAGKAGTADKLAASRTFTFTGDVTGSATFDGSGNVSIALTLANSGVAAGTYSAVQVDSKGRVVKGQQFIVFATSLDDSALNDLAIGGIAVVDA